jgi:sugar-specific transcriptional regulator TrmB
MLKSVGLGEAKEAVYLALVRQGGTSVAQLAERVGLTVAQVRRAVAALQREGFVHRTPPPHELVVPVPPEVAVEQLVQRHQEELERIREEADRLTAEAYNRPSNRRTEELIEIVTGQDAVGWAFDRVQRAARRQMRLLVAPPYAASTGGSSPDSLHAIAETALALLPRPAEPG